MAALPPLRPLVLILKTLLQQKGLNQVFSGGLSSWSLLLLVIAHLQSEGMGIDLDWQPARAADGSQPFVEVEDAMRFLKTLRDQQEELEEQVLGQLEEEWQQQEELKGQVLGQLELEEGQQQIPQLGGQYCWDYGYVLLGFLKRFSMLFDLESEAVDVLAGGVVNMMSGMQRPAKSSHLLVLKDPVEVERVSVAHGTTQIKKIMGIFETVGAELERELERAMAAKQADVPEAAAIEDAWAADFPLLSVVINVGQVLGSMD